MSRTLPSSHTALYCNTNAHSNAEEECKPECNAFHLHDNDMRSLDKIALGLDWIA